MQQWMKQCSRCRALLDPERVANYCPPCQSEYQTAYRKRKKEGGEGSILPPYDGLPRGPEIPRVVSQSMLAEHVRLYGGKQKLRVSKEDRQKILDNQNGLCAICTRVITYENGALDHDHQPPYALRGYLCFQCNVGLGQFRDDPDLLQTALDYIRRYQEVDPQEETV